MVKSKAGRARQRGAVGRIVGPAGALLLTLLLWLQPAGAVQRLTPPEVVGILTKFGDKETLSAAELTTLTRWYGGESAKTELELAMEEDDDEPDPEDPRADLLQSNPNVHLGAVQAPSKDEYLALAREAQGLFAERLDPVLRQELDREINKATRTGFGADLGGVLILCQDAPAAVYASAVEALESPDDALTANNLGACLKAVREYPRALRILLYARSIGPELVLATTNLGWTQALMGDTATGEQTFRAALEQDPDDALAAEGLGLLAMARGDIQTALEILVRSVKLGYLPGAKAGIEILSDPEFTRGERGDDGAGNPGGGATVPPLEHPTGKGSGAPPSFVNPPPIGTLKEAMANDDAVRLWCFSATEQLLPVIARHTAVATQGGMARARREMEAGPNVWLLSNEREQFAMNKLAVVFGNRVSRLEDECHFNDLESELRDKAERLRAQYEAECEDCLALPLEQHHPCAIAAGDRFCQRRLELANEYYGRIVALWKGYREQAIKELIDYYHFCSPWLADVQDPGYNEELNLFRQIHIRTIDSNVRMRFFNLYMACRTVASCGELHPGEAEQQDLKVGDDGPGKCKVATFSITLHFVGLEGSCDKLKLDINAGVLTSIEYKPGKSRDRDETTVFVGAGLKSKGGPIEVGVEAGGYITVRGDGKLVDVGMKESLGGSINLGPVSVSGQIEGRIGIESGLNGSVTPIAVKLGASHGADE